MSATCISAMSESLLTVTDIHTYYGDSYVLQGLSLSLPNGRIAAILGRNGMGKTTLIRSVAGLTPPRSGEVVFRGRSLRGMPSYAIAQQGIAIIPQGRRIFKSLSVRENLLLPTSPLARSSYRGANAQAGRRWHFEEVLKEFPQLAERIDNPGGSLSGGEQQMLAIGRALMANPELILMDEPSEGLSPRLVLQIQEIMQRLRSLGQAILLVEQNLRLALSAADEVYVLSAGRFVFQGTATALANETQVLDQHLGVSIRRSIHSSPS
jgi:branched-chain amino acid transport system ATP-binding protein